MKWLEIGVHVHEDAADIASIFMQDMGAVGVAIEEAAWLTNNWETPFGELYELNKEDYPSEGVRVRGYFTIPSDKEELQQHLRVQLQAAAKRGLEIGSCETTSQIVDEVSWAEAWKTYFKPLCIGKNIWIVPEWEDFTPPPNAFVVLIDPGMAFGTGTHPTTALCLAQLEQLIKGNEKVVDVGAGSGILSIAAAILGASEVWALDLDPVAVNSAKDNASLNHVSEKITITCNNLLDGMSEKLDGGADLLIANILSGIILKFPQDAWDCLKPGGLYLVSGIIKREQDLICEALLSIGFQLKNCVQQEDWIVLLFERPNQNVT